MVRMVGLVVALTAVVAANQVDAAVRLLETVDSRWTHCSGVGVQECIHVRKVAVESPVDPFQGKVWRLFELVAAAGGAPMHPSVPITLEVDAATGQVSGKGGCNRYFAGAKLAGTQFTLAGIGSTQMACPPPAMDEEAAYLAALERVTGYAVEGDVLTLTLMGGGQLRYRELLD